MANSIQSYPTKNSSPDDYREVTSTDLSGNKVGLDVVAPNVESSLTSLINITSQSLLSGISWDYFTVDYPDSVTEVYTFRSGGVGGTVVREIELIYTNNTKNELSSGGIL